MENPFEEYVRRQQEARKAKITGALVMSLAGLFVAVVVGSIIIATILNYVE